MASRQSPRSPGRSAGVDDPLGAVLLVTGPEELLNERAMRAARAGVLARQPEAETSEVLGAQLSSGSLGELTAPSLFSTTRCVTVRMIEDAPEEAYDGIVAYASSPDPDIALVLVHSGGQKGVGLLNRLRKLPTVSEQRSEPVRGGGLMQFVQQEARSHGARLDPEGASLLVEAVGPDLRGLAAAADQLAHDFPGRPLTADLVGQYFSGRADVKGFEVADHALQGRTATALEELRWALQTGVSGPAMTGSFASAVRGLARVKSARGGARDADVARDAGVPPWKVSSLRQQARGWDEEALAVVVRAVAKADAEVKGAGADEAYALEQMILTIAGARASREAPSGPRAAVGRGRG